MSTFRKYGGTQFSAINNVTRSFISNSEHMKFISIRYYNFIKYN